jgi:3' exoribonuclease, RNase T-like
MGNRVWFDTEFIEDGRTIDLISIGLVRADGAELYLESDDVDWRKANPWVLENVHPHLDGANRKTRPEIAQLVRGFVGESPEFWAYYADYDWVVLCQLYGCMIDLPKGWPMYCRDLKQLLDAVGALEFIDAKMPPQSLQEHHALADARWVRDTHLWLERG